MKVSATSEREKLRLQSAISRTEEWGGTGGDSFDDSTQYLDRPMRISKIEVRHGKYVDAINVVYEDGRTCYHGGKGGTKDIINLDKDEHITRVYGRYGGYIDKIHFETNKGKKYGPWGSNKGYHDFDARLSQPLLYIFGRAKDVIERLGLAYGPQPEAALSPVYKIPAKGNEDHSLFDDLTSYKPGRKITAIKVRYHNKAVDGIQIRYNGEWGKLQGGSGGTEVQFDIPSDDYLAKISGKHERSLNCIQFHTAKGRVSPRWGDDRATSYEIKDGSKPLIGIHGMANMASNGYVHTLGAYSQSGVVSRVQMRSIEYEENDALLLEGKPIARVKAYLKNEKSGPAELTQTVSYEEETASTVYTRYHWEWDFELEYTAEFKVMVVTNVLNVTVGGHFEESYETMETIRKKFTHTYEFKTEAGPYKTVLGEGFAKQYVIDVPWTANARIWYADKPEYEDQILTGTYEGVGLSQIEAVYTEQ